MLQPLAANLTTPVAGQNPPERMAGVSIAKDAPILYRSDRNEHKAPENGEHRWGARRLDGG
jgi:hypothetical protein